MSNRKKTAIPKPGSKAALVPKLRFPEFGDADAWIQAQIGDIAASQSSTLALNKLSLRPKGYSVYGADSCVGFIDSFAQDEDYIAIVKDGSGVGRLSLKQGKSSVLSTLAYIKCQPNSRTTLAWLFYCLNSLDLRKFVKGSGIPHIYFSDYATQEVFVPAPPEQQKIAECLSSADDLITAHARKLDALKTHKKGLMQQLFPREGETQPGLRFPEFRDAGVWQHSSIGDLVSSNCLLPPKDGNHGDIHPKSSDYVANGIPFIMASDLNGGFIDTSTCHFISKDQADRLQKGFAKEGDVLLSHKGTVGEVAVVKKIMTPYLMLTPQVTYYRVKDQNKLSNLFLAQIFVSDVFQSNLRKVSGGGTRAYIGITEQAKLSIVLPKDMNEQQRIADCLTTLDDLIAAQTQKLDAIKTHKKGLMQQLFPSLEAVEA
jgi:type I restriction enzyme, S subunit